MEAWHFLFSLLLILDASHLCFTEQFHSSVSHTDWVKAPVAVLKKRYFAYEYCVLTSPKQYNLSETVHKQSRCLHLIDEALEKLPKRCWFGSKQQLGDDGTCFGNQCLSLENRPGFSKHYDNLGIPSHNSSLGFEADVVAVAQQLYFDVMMFTGDSMAVQMAQRFVCGILRKSPAAVPNIFGDFFNFPPGGASASINIGGSPTSSYFMVSATRVTAGIGLSSQSDKYTPLKGIDAHCGMQNITCRRHFAAVKIYKLTKDAIKHGKKWGNTLHIFILPVILKQSFEYKPMARALLDVAKNLRKISSVILILSPFTQHFSNHPRGLYEGYVPKKGATACAPLLNFTRNYKVEEHPDSVHTKAALSSLDPNWEESLGFFDADFYSIPWYDLHPEARATGWSADCTHYSYNPMMYDAVYKDIALYLKRQREINAKWLDGMQRQP